MKIYDNDYYYEDERLYSTGNDDLDILLEKAFSDGYYFAQRVYSKETEILSRIKQIYPYYAKNPTVGPLMKKSFINRDFGTLDRLAKHYGALDQRGTITRTM